MSFSARNQLLRALKLATDLSQSQKMKTAGAVLMRATSVNDRRTWHLYFESNAMCLEWVDKEGAD